ncbi:MAG: 4Fe-4S dicluster domain-containing protein, partial [Thermodesulfobacteriota bacterium]
MTRWVMLIDLDKCTGCQACTIACKVENNVPHGSLEEHKNQREIYWNKMIAVTNGEYPNIQTLLIPMTCMHCERAPCVTVC